MLKTSTELVTKYNLENKSASKIKTQHVSNKLGLNCGICFINTYFIEDEGVVNLQSTKGAHWVTNRLTKFIWLLWMSTS